MRTEAPVRLPSQRNRSRAATERGIRATARRLLVEHGADGLSLRAIARAMGMTAPALYRYHPSRENLVERLVGDLYAELTGMLAAAGDRHRPDDTGGSLLAVSRAFRRWALEHPGEFRLMFGSPAGGR